MPVLIQHNILRLEISIDYVLLMQVLEGQKNLGSVDPSLFFGEGYLIH